MNETQRKWLLDLQEKGFRFNEYHDDLAVWMENSELLDFTRDLDCYRIPAQPIPDIPDWREVCMEMYDKGMKFEIFDKWNGRWINSVGLFDSIIERYRIQQQSLPKWKEEMTEETKPDPREEIPHRELQIQWHEDMLHHLRTGEPMRMWEWKKKSDGTWGQTIEPGWDAKTEYRRKPRTVTYWHCVVLFDGSPEIITGYGVNEMKYQVDRCKKTYPLAKIGPITETTVELED